MPDDEVNLHLKVSDRARWSSEVNRAKKDIDDLGHASEIAGRKAGSSAGGFGIFKSALSGIGGVLRTGIEGLGILGAAAVVLGGKLVKMGNDAQQIRLRFTETFTDLTPQMDSFIKTVNQRFGFPTVDLQNAAAQFGRFATAAQLPHPAIATFSTDMINAGLNLSAFYNKAPTDVFKAITSGLAGLTRPLRNYGIFIEEANVQAEAMKAGLGGTTLAQHKSVEATQALAIALAKQHEAMTKFGASSVQAATASLAVERAQDGIAKATEGSKINLTDAQRVMLRQRLITEQLGAANGALERRLDTTAGQWRIFTGRIKDTGYTIGTALLPLGNTLLHLLNDEAKPVLSWLSTNAPIWTDRLSRGLGRVNTVLHDAIVAFHVGGFEAFAHSIDTSVGAGGRLESALRRIGGDLADVWRIVRYGVVPAVLIVGGVALWLAGKLTPLDSILHYLGNHASIVRDILVVVTGVLVANAVATAALMAIEGTATVVKTLYTLATSGYTAALVANTAATDANVVGAGVMQAVLASGLVRLTASAGGWLVHAASVAIDTAGRYAWLAASVVGEFLVEGVQLTIIAAKWILLGVAMGAATVAQYAARGATLAWAAAQWLLNVAMDANPAYLIIAAIALLVVGIVYLVTHVAVLRNAFVDAWTWVVGHWPLLLAILIGPIAIAVYTIIHFRDQIIAAFKGAINWIIRAWNSLHFHVPGFTAGPVHFGGIDLGTPHIPELHTGGVTVSPGLVNIQPNEEMVYLPAGAAVVPLPERTDTPPPDAGPGTAPREPQVVQLVVDSKVLAEVMLTGTSDIVARR